MAIANSELTKIQEVIEKERAALEKLETKKQIIEGQIKDRKAKIGEYENIANQRRFSEITDVIHAKGLSLEELTQAIKDGDLSALQGKLVSAETASMMQSQDLEQENVKI